MGYYGIDAEEKWLNAVQKTHLLSLFFSRNCVSDGKPLTAILHQNTKIIRLGIVLSAKGGILPQMLMPIRLNLVDKIDMDGNRWFGCIFKMYSVLLSF